MSFYCLRVAVYMIVWAGCDPGIDSVRVYRKQHTPTPQLLGIYGFETTRAVFYCKV